MTINKTIILILIFIIFSCESNRDYTLFSGLKQNNSIDFKYENNLKNIDGVDFYKYSFNVNNEKINLFFGKKSDTIFIINPSPLLNSDGCYVKFPFLILKKNKTIVEPISNCYDIPVLTSSYEINVIDISDGVYIIEYSPIETPQGIQNPNDKCIIKFSLKEGIIDFNYNHFLGNYKLPWYIPN